MQERRRDEAATLLPRGISHDCHLLQWALMSSAGCASSGGDVSMFSVDMPVESPCKMRAKDHTIAMAPVLPLLPHGRPTVWRPMSICDALPQTLSSTTDTGFKCAPCLTRCARERGAQGGVCVVAPFPRLRFLFRCGRDDPLSS